MKTCSVCEQVAKERDALKAELNEQARLVGMSGERELAMRAENARLREALEVAEAYVDSPHGTDATGLYSKMVIAIKKGLGRV